MKRLLLVLGLSLAWSRPWAMAASANSQSAATPLPPPKGEKAQKVFKKGLEAFDKKNYDEAISAFRSILIKQPDHTASLVFIARSLYLQKNIVEALKAFRELDLKDLDPEAAYDYGQAAYRSAEHEMAAKAFAAVPNGHALYDLAGFYGGISAYKSGDYQQAIDFFDQAVVLPSKLVRSQKLYRGEAEKKLFQRQKAEVQSTGAPAAKSKKEPAAQAFVYRPASGVYLSHAYKNQTSEPKRGKSEDVDMQRTTLALSWGSDRPPVGARSQWLYLVDVKGASTRDNEKERLILPSPSETLESIALQRYESETLVRSEVGAGYESIIGSTSTMGFMIGAYSYASDGDFVKKILYSPYLSLSLSQSGDSLETRVSVETHPRFDANRLFITQTVQDGSLVFNFTKSLFLGIKGQLNEYNYNAQRLNGPDWNGRGQLEVGYKKGQSLSLTLGSFYEIGQGWRLYEADQQLPLVKFNLSQAGGYVRADIGLTSWWTFGFQGKFVQSSYANVLPVEGQNFPLGGETYLDENFGSKISQFSLTTSLFKNF
jgi:tetratricopeptide (TPR) repeat protein